MKKVVTVLIAAMLCGLLLAACSHTHVWKEATCVTPVFCEVCGETKGEALAQSWTEATCTDAKTCSVCGKTEGEPIGHQWKEATCTDAKNCSLCGKTEGEPIAHQWEDANCLEPKKCKVCAGTEGAALGHEATEWKIVTAATCQQEGKSTGTCVRCGEIAEKVLEKLEHTPGEWKIGVKATVNEKGKRTQECTACKTVLKEEVYELSGEEYEAAYKDACEKYGFSEIARAPGQYKGKMAKFTGEVIQVQQEMLLGKIYYVMRVNITKTGNYYTYYTDTIYVTYTADEDDPRILEDDIVTMYGELQGEKTYTTVMGASVTIPSFSAEYIDIK